MRKLRYRTAILLNYIQVISFLTIPVYIIFALLTINYISNILVVIFSLTASIFLVKKYVNIETVLK